MKDFNELQFVRITNAEMFWMIPRKLFDDIKEKSYDVDMLYKMAGQYLSPTSFMFLLVDAAAQIKGFLWFYLNLLNKKAQVNILTVDSEYQGSMAIQKTAEFIKSLDKDLTIEIMTSRPKAFEKAGFKRSETLIMEI